MKSKNYLFYFVLIIIPGILYSLTIARTFSYGNFGWDGGDLLACIYNFGLPHPPGYPLYLLIGRLFGTLLFFIPDLGFRINIMDAFFAILTLIFLYKNIVLITKNEVAGLLTGLFFAFSYIFWSQALIVEVTTLHTFFLIIISYFAIKWTQSTEREQAKQKNNKYIYVVMVLVSLAATNHPTVILIIPGLLFLLISVNKAFFKNKRNILVSLACIILPGLLYLYVPIRGASHPFAHWGSLVTFKEVWDYLTASQYHGYFLTSDTLDIFTNFKFYLKAIYENLTIYGLILSASGFYFLIKMNQVRVFVYLALTSFIIFMFNLLYVSSDITEVYNVNFYLFLMIPVGISMAYIWNNLNNIGLLKKIPIKLIKGLFLLSIICLIFIQISTNYEKVDVSKDFEAKEYAESIIPNIEEDQAVLIKSIQSDSISFTMRYYLTTVYKRNDILHLGSSITKVPSFLKELKYLYPHYNWPQEKVGDLSNEYTVEYNNQFIEANKDQYAIYLHYDHLMESDKEIRVDDYTFKKITKHLYKLMSEDEPKEEKVYETVDLSDYER